MRGTILVTDSLFIFEENERLLRKQGYEIDRLDTPEASEEELIEHIRGKVGYILGGTEKVSSSVIDSGNELRAIVFAGADWRHFIPGHPRATARKIPIANAPGANSYAVAEFTATLMLAMTRSIFELGRTGEEKFKTMRSLNELTVGVIGMGRSGAEVARILHGLRAGRIIYHSRRRKPEIEAETHAEFVRLEELLRIADVVTFHISKEAGDGFIGTQELASMKDHAVIINCGYTGSVDKKALFTELHRGRLRAAYDSNLSDDFNELPLSNWFNSNAHTAFNTTGANKVTSDMVTQSMINLLATGKDQHLANL